MDTLQDSEIQFRVLAEALPQLVWTTDPAGNPGYCNQRWLDFIGAPKAGSSWVSVAHPDDRPQAQERWSRAMESGEPFEGEVRLRAADGEYRWFFTRALPMKGQDGRTVRWFGTCTDIDRQKSGEEALRRLDAQHRLALEAAEMGTWDYDPESGRISWDERSCALFGLESADLRSLSVTETLLHVHPDDRSRVEADLSSALHPGSEGRYDAEYRIVLRDGRVRWLHARGQAFFEGAGAGRRTVRFSGVVSDVTRRRTGDEARTLLIRELNHRVKNLFAIASGMVSMTARTAKSPKEMAEALRGRLGALSRAHELVRPAFGIDDQAGHATTLAQLIKAILDPYAESGGGSRLRLEGPPVIVGANTVTSLALVLHELATNAAKYGCLSEPEGRLAISWTVGADDVALAWVETGGPPISEEPVLQGFGSQLAQKSITGQLGGALDHTWLQHGLEVRMRLPLDRLSS
jgi:PAS domain S-box-containing protein